MLPCRTLLVELARVVAKIVGRLTVEHDGYRGTCEVDKVFHYLRGFLTT
jgi:hypothetical protein